jgi:hypothetical protein
LTGRAGDLVIVEGQLVNAGAAFGRHFLNFGSNRRHDLALVATNAAVKRFANAGLPIDSYVGRYVRARGELDFSFSPRIEIDEPVQIELLPGPPGAPPRQNN